MRFIPFLCRALVALTFVFLLVEVSALQMGTSGTSSTFDGSLHVWTALAAGTVSIDVVVLTAALMFNFTSLSLAVKFAGWMALWHAAFTLLSTGLAVGALAVGRWFGAEGAAGGAAILAGLNLGIFVGAAFFIFSFFHKVVRKNALAAELEIGGNVLQTPWRSKIFQGTILSACFDALYLVKPAMYGGYSTWVSFQSILLLGVEVGIVALIGGFICFFLARRLNRTGGKGRYRFMLRGVMAEFFAFPFFMFWNLAKAIEAGSAPFFDLKIGLGVVGIVSLSYSWWYWHQDHQGVEAATLAKASGR